MRTSWEFELWATARLNQAPVVFSEGFDTGAILDGVRFMNPLAERFDLVAWS